MNRTLLALLALLYFGCKEEGTPPPSVKDPRTYSWTVDTITYPGSFQTTMRSIYATDPDNVYIVGHNDNPGTPSMFHYDGSRWTTTNFHSSAGGTISGAVSLSKVHGFGASDIWVAGERIYQIGNTFPDSSFLMHFDGTRWTEAMIADGRGRLLQSLWGATSTDIWAGGVNTLLHYNGVEWSHFPIEMPGQGIQFFSMSGVSSSEVYLMGYRNDVVPPADTTSYLLYEFDGFQWSVRDSIVQVSGLPVARFGLTLGNVAGEIYSLSTGVYRMTSSTWELLCTVPEPLTGISGPRRDNLFLVGLGGQVIHFNSHDAYQYPQFQNYAIDLYSVWTTDEQVFAVGNDGSRSYVARGK